MSRLLWLDGREPRADAAVVNPESAQFHLWLAQAQRDHNNISDHEMAQIEGKAMIMAARSQILWNPFTGEFRTRQIREHYASGKYLEVNSEEVGPVLTRLITGD